MYYINFNRSEIYQSIQLKHGEHEGSALELGDQLGTFGVEFLCLHVLGLLPQFKDMNVRGTGDSTLALGLLVLDCKSAQSDFLSVAKCHLGKTQTQP